MEKTDREQMKELATDMLAVLAVQQQFFAARKAGLPEAQGFLAQSKAKERDLKKKCEAIVNGEQKSLF